jgi:hypothetical protein
MHGWGWAARAGLAEVTKGLTAIAKRRKLIPVADKKDGSVFLRIAEIEGCAIVIGNGVPGADFASELTKTLGCDARYAEVEVHDRRVMAHARDIAKDGVLGAEEKRDEEASELCEAWFEGKKYRTEAVADLVSIFLDFDDTPKGELLSFDRTGSMRVAMLVDAVRRGAKWEKTTVGGRVAIKVTEAGASRMSVLDDDELAQFHDELK